jgi:hypothetical protein
MSAGNRGVVVPVPARRALFSALALAPFIDLSRRVGSTNPPASAATMPCDITFVSQVRPDLSRGEVDRLLDGIAAAWLAAKRDDPLAEGDVA